MLIYGKNTIIEALKSGQIIKKLFLNKKKRNVYSEIIDMARNNLIEIELRDDNFFLERLKNSIHQGIAASITSISSLSRDLDTCDKEFILIADSIMDPMNLGAIIRSSILFNIDGFIIPERESCGITPTVIKASSGAVFHQQIFTVKNLRNAIKTLKSENFWIYGLDMNTDLKINNIKINRLEKIALVIGSEGKGMHRIIRESCDFIINIPTTRKIDSLNASTAASIAMWEIYKRKFLFS